MVTACPVCGEEGGFHDHAKHARHQVPRELLLEKDWWKEAHEEIKKKRAEKLAEAMLIS